jgi:hypothetical protein
MYAPYPFTSLFDRPSCLFILHNYININQQEYTLIKEDKENQMLIVDTTESIANFDCIVIILYQL